MPKVTISTKKISKRKARKIFQKTVEQSPPEVVLDEIIEEMNQFEKKFGMSTVKFYRRYRAGEMGDGHDVMLWAGIYETYVALMKSYRLPETASK